MPVKETSQHSFDQEIRRISKKLIIKAGIQAKASKINVEHELQKIDKECSITSEINLREKPSPSQFHKTALYICDHYKPELAYVMTLELNNLEESLGFKPYGYTLFAIANPPSIDCLEYSKTFSEKHFLSEKLSPQYILKAGKIISRTIFMGSGSFYGSKTIYNIPMNQKIRTAVNDELAKIDNSDLANAIIMSFTALKAEITRNNRTVFH